MNTIEDYKPNRQGIAAKFEKNDCVIIAIN